jgi:BMFP domain-containing protein YqiC
LLLQWNRPGFEAAPSIAEPGLASNGGGLQISRKTFVKFWSPDMPQTRSRFFDDLSKLMTDAAGLADGARREVDTALRGQLERLLAGMDVVAREEFEAVRDMAALARAENDRLRERVAALEAKLDSIVTQSTRPTPQP